MAARAVIVERRQVAQKKMMELAEQIGGREVREKLEAASRETRDPSYIEMRREEVLVEVWESLLESNVIREETGLEAVKGIGPEVADALRNAGYTTKADLREASNEDLMRIPGIGGKTVREIRKQL